MLLKKFNEYSIYFEWSRFRGEKLNALIMAEKEQRFVTLMKEAVTLIMMCKKNTHN